MNIKKTKIKLREFEKLKCIILTSIILVLFFFKNNIYSQSKDLKSKNIISIKKSIFSTLLLKDNNSLIFNQSKPSSNLFNNTFSDYNISFQRRVNSRLFLGIDYYSFNSFNEIDPISLSLSLAGLERKNFLAKTGIQQVRISVFYTILNNNNFIIRAGLYIPFFREKTTDLTLIYQEKMNENNLIYNSASDKDSKLYLGIVTPEVAIDFLYNFSFLEAGISTSWNSTTSENEPMIRFSAVLNINL
jgi:hypothetical protein